MAQNTRECPKCLKYYKEKHIVKWNTKGFWNVLFSDEVGVKKEDWQEYEPEKRQEIYQKMLKDFDAVPFLNEDGTPHFRCLATFVEPEVAKKYFKEYNYDFSIDFVMETEETKEEEKKETKIETKKAKKGKKAKKKTKKEKEKKTKKEDKKEETKEEAEKREPKGKVLMSFKQTMEIVTGKLLKIKKAIERNNENLLKIKESIETNNKALGELDIAILRLKAHLEEVYKEYNIPEE